MTDPSTCLSRKLGPLAARVEALVRDYSRVWQETPGAPWFPEKVYRAAEKKETERELSTLVDRLSSERDSRTEEENLDPSLLEAFAAEIRPFFQRILKRADLKIESVYDSQFVESTRNFLQSARDFDPDLSIASVYQALRNVWIMNTLQFYLGLEAAHTDAIFGYSMIYPYLDNALDDTDRTTSDKQALLLRLRAWLEGDEMSPSSAQEERLRILVGMIEHQFSRAGFPGVYQSMLSIFNGQIKSLMQQRGTLADKSDDILGISVEKGGTSVLADGYLVAGELRPDQEDFCFGFGVFLQFADDLQDIAEDVARGHRTLFSQEAARRRLDPLVYRLLRYTSLILEQKLDGSIPREKALQDMIRANCSLMYLESVGKYNGYFSRACVRRFQRAFPVRFGYLRKIRGSIETRFLTGHEKISDLDPVSAAFLTLSSRAFSLD